MKRWKGGSREWNQEINRHNKKGRCKKKKQAERVINKG
jgi:hypothetical protein